MQLTWPPPPVEVSAAPAATATTPAPAASARTKVAAVARTPAASRRWGSRRWLLFVLVAIAPPALQGHLTVFALAIVIGYYVIGNVHHALHTPLMSVTNAITGIIVVGALLQIGHDGAGGSTTTVLSAVAILLATINVFGGFAVTRRMLAMFTRG